MKCRECGKPIKPEVTRNPDGSTVLLWACPVDDHAKREAVGEYRPPKQKAAA